MRILPRLSSALLAAALLAPALHGAPATPAPDPAADDLALLESLATPVQRDARLAWWREARFGMFVHWGVSSVLGGSWQGQKYGGYAEHIQRARRIPMPVYRTEVVEKFNPVKFDADAWMRLAKDAGMGYFIITAKHHDGFAMFDSKASDYNVVKATPYKHDPMKDLRAAARKHGVRFGFYYSHAFDWGEENAPGNDWDWKNPGGDKLLHGANWWEKFPEFLPKARQYVDTKAIPQLVELIQNYEPDIIWFDTPHKLPPSENVRILAAVRKTNPNVVVNGRIFSSAWPELGKLTDYKSTTDKPAEFYPVEGDWEGIPTTNESYGYNQSDKSHKPPAHFIRLLAKAAARGGNILMNIGPMGDGAIEEVDVKILDAIAAWWKTNGESIRGTTRTPLPVQAWGESTRKGNQLYLHVFDWPSDGQLVVGGLQSPIAAARLLGAPDTPLKVAGNTISVPASAPDAVDSVVVLECAGAPVAGPVRLLSTRVKSDTLRAFDASLVGALQFGNGKSNSDWATNWKSLADAVVWPVRLDAPASFDVTITYDAPHDTLRNRLVEGDAGKELARANRGCGGTYMVKFGSHTIEKPVRDGLRVTESLGRLTLPAGSHEISVSAKEITKEELMRLQSLTLVPVL